MRAYWDGKARENAMYYIHSLLDYSRVDEAEFWSSGRDNLDRTLEIFDRRIGADDRVVEIGCGIGRITRAIAERAASVVAIDVSSEMVNRCRQALGGLDNVSVLLGSGSDLSGIPDATADVVYSFIVFQHVPDPRITCQYIRDMGRVLRPGGWAIFQVSEDHDVHRRERWVGADSWSTRIRRLIGRAPRDLLAPQWLGSALRREDLLDALARGGLTLDGAVGDGTQFCLVHAVKPVSSPAED